ncbi:T3SS effector NleG family protein, partial [Escherichia coli]
KFPVSSGNFQCPPESIQCPITLERPEVECVNG